MKILLYHWIAYSNRFLEDNLKRMGHEVIVWYDEKFKDESAESTEKLCIELDKGYDIVFSYNYFKVVALACREKGVPYFSWTQDSPMLSLYDETCYFDTNFFFCFDYEQLEGMKKRGIKNTYYCPLATDVSWLTRTADNCTVEDIKKYKADISFVGSIYSEKNMFSTLNGFPELLKGYFAGITEAQLALPAIRFSKTNISIDVMDMLRNVLNFTGTIESKIKYEELIDNLIDRQVTSIERERLIDRLSHKADFKLYTTSDTSKLPLVNNCGTVDYYNQMPKVFRHSLINMNVTLRSIRSGIPLRILDVIGSRGFLLTNTQPELELFFKEGESIATFRNLEEMNEKIDYYLLHDDERKKIIENGYRIVTDQFDFKVRLPQMFEMAGIRLK